MVSYIKVVLFSETWLMSENNSTVTLHCNIVSHSHDIICRTQCNNYDNLYVSLNLTNITNLYKSAFIEVLVYPVQFLC